MAKLNSSNIGPGGNWIINGDAAVLQAGVIGTMYNSDYWGDQWKYIQNGSMVNYGNRGATVPTLAESGHLSPYCIAVDVTTGDPTIGAGDFSHIEQPIEGYILRQLWGNWVTLSFWHKHYRTGTYSVSIRNAAATESYVMEYTQDVTETWEKEVLTFKLYDTAGTWVFTNAVALYVGFNISCGTTYSTSSLNQWVSGNYIASSNQENGNYAAADIFRLSQVKLEVGTQATPFYDRPYHVEQALCQRYYETGHVQDIASVYNASYIQLPRNIFAQAKRTSSPSVSLSSVSWLPGSGGGFGTIGTIYSTTRDEWSYSNIYNTTAGTLGYSGKVQYDYAATDQM